MRPSWHRFLAFPSDDQNTPGLATVALRLVGDSLMHLGSGMQDVGEALARRLPDATPGRSSLARCGRPAVPRRANAAGTAGHGPRRIRERGRRSGSTASATGEQNHHAGADPSRPREAVSASRGGARCTTLSALKNKKHEAPGA